MKYIETKRCRNIRRVLIAMFVVCGYMLSTTFAYAEINEEWVSMTALNLAFGSMGADHPVYKNTFFGLMYIVIPLIGFFFMFFDHKSNLKNLVGIVCGIVGCAALALPLGASEALYIGIGAVVSMVLYIVITTLSAISIFMKIEDDHKKEAETADSGKRLPNH